MIAIKKKNTDVNMTEGSIFRHLIKFAIPLLIGNLFQMVYNMVDTWVVGNYVSDTAFSAVGTLGPVTNLMVGFFLGLASGAGVVISQYFGSKQFDMVKKTVNTAIVTTLVLSVLFTLLGLCFVEPVMLLLDMPQTVKPEAVIYLTTWFSGISGVLIYNMGSGIMRAVGDSKRPFIFLVISAVANTVLDLVFVLVFHMGVFGVAFATIISQWLSSILIVISLIRTDSCVRVEPLKIRFDLEIFKKIVKVGIPAALQMALTSFSNIFVQSYINHFGDSCMGGWTAYTKIDQIILLPMQSLALASTTFVGQNLGCGLVDRAKSGVKTALIMSICATAFLIVPVVVFSDSFIWIFNRNPEIIEYGTLFLRCLTPFYMFMCFNQIFAGALRGSGNTTAPTVIMLISFVGFRQLYLFVMANYISNTILPIAMGFPAGWVLASVITIIYYSITDLSKGSLVGDINKNSEIKN